MTNESSEFEKAVTKADEMDGYQIYMMEDKGICIMPLSIIESRQRLAEIEATYQYNLTAEIPTWMSFETWRAINRSKKRENTIIKFFVDLFKATKSNTDR